jgi:hypothetical protein
MRAVCLMLVCGGLIQAEIIDRIAVSLEKRIITRGAIEAQVRVAAFLNREPLEINARTLRRAGERMIEQSLIKQEMEFSRYTMPEESEAVPMMDQLRATYPSEDEFFKQLASYGLTARDVRAQLLLQLSTLRFIQLRFRPSVTVGDGEIEIYYREQFVPKWEKDNRGQQPPPVEDAYDQIVEVLTQEKTDHALNLWLRDARSQVRVRFFEEAFQ